MCAKCSETVELFLQGHGLEDRLITIADTVGLVGLIRTHHTDGASPASGGCLCADCRQVWAHVYGRDNLSVAPGDHAVLLTEAPLNPYQNRRQCAETFFETFGVPAMFCAPQVVPPACPLTVALLSKVVADKCHEVASGRCGRMVTHSKAGQAKTQREESGIRRPYPLSVASCCEYLRDLPESLIVVDCDCFVLSVSSKLALQVKIAVIEHSMHG